MLWDTRSHALWVKVVASLGASWHLSVKTATKQSYSAVTLLEM